MIATIWNFLIHGILLKPSVFFGLIGGVLAYIFLPLGQLYAICIDYRLYLGFFGWAFFYAVIYRRSYKDNYNHIDWFQSFLNVIKQWILLTIAVIVGIIGIYYFDSTQLNIHYNDPERAEYNRFLNLEQKTLQEQ